MDQQQDYHLIVNEQDLGPLEVAEVCSLLRQKSINSKTLVWRNGLEDWTPLYLVPEFSKPPEIADSIWANYYRRSPDSQRESLLPGLNTHQNNTDKSSEADASIATGRSTTERDAAGEESRGEKMLLSVHPSHSNQLADYLFGVLTLPFVIGLFFIARAYLRTVSWTLTLDEQHLEIEEGVFTKTTNILELKRVRDIRLVQGFFQRVLFRTGSIVIHSSDSTDPKLEIKGVREPRYVFDMISLVVEARRHGEQVVRLEK